MRGEITTRQVAAYKKRLRLVISAVTNCSAFWETPFPPVKTVRVLSAFHPGARRLIFAFCARLGADDVPPFPRIDNGPPTGIRRKIR